MGKSDIMYLRCPLALKQRLQAAHAAHAKAHAMEPRMTFAEFVGRMLAQAAKDEMWPT